MLSPRIPKVGRCHCVIAALVVGTTACGSATTGPDRTPRDPWANDSSRVTNGGTTTTSGTGGTTPTPTPTPTPAPDVVDRLTLDWMGVCIRQGYTSTFNATMSHLGADGVWRSADASDVQWTIGDSTVAELSTTRGSRVVVKALRQGSTILTASVLRLRATAQVFVSGALPGAPLTC